MKRNNKKGFTIVELVIVIAVIAILAAVLIPTFSGIIRKANLSADQQAVRQMNTALAVDGAVTPTDIFALHEVLDELGLTSEDYHPLTKGTYFFWDADLNRILHVDENMVVITPAEYAGQAYVAGTSNWFSLTLEIAEEKIDGVNNGATVTIANGAQMQYVLNKLDEGTIKTLTIELEDTIDMMGAIFSLPKFDANAGYDITISGPSADNKAVIKNATSVDFAQDAISHEDGNDGVYYSALIPYVGGGNEVTISNVVIENMNVKGTHTSGVALLIGAIWGDYANTHAKGIANIENVVIKNSTVIGHRNTGALVGQIGHEGVLNIKGTLELEDVDVKTVGGRSAMLVALINGASGNAGAGVINAAGATIKFDEDCSYGIYECEQNTGKFGENTLGLTNEVKGDGKTLNSYALENGKDGFKQYTYVEKALIMTGSNTADKTGATVFAGATITGWN